MQDIEADIRKLFFKHTNNAPPKELVLELGELVQTVIGRSVKQQSREGAVVPVRDLEEILSVVRNSKELYENKDPHTTEDILRLDELKQLEYKLTEKILANR